MFIYFTFLEFVFTGLNRTSDFSALGCSCFVLVTLVDKKVCIERSPQLMKMVLKYFIWQYFAMKILKFPNYENGFKIFYLWIFFSTFKVFKLQNSFKIKYFKSIITIITLLQFSNFQKLSITNKSKSSNIFHSQRDLNKKAAIFLIPREIY